MPRTTKDSEKDELNKKKTTTKKKNADAQATKSRTKKETASSDEKKEVKPKNSKTTTQKATTTKKATSSKKSTSSSAKKTTSASAKKGSAATPKSSTTRKKTTVKKLEENIVAEYYDLPYRYNETIVKILYQTPTILFVYWDISDFDKENFIKLYGENFFNNTRPVLKIYNLTKNYSFEVEINDFANSWYINVNDANCRYKVELSRKAINYVENLNSDYVYISSSNDIEFPNDHILLEELPNKIKFKNVKTNQESTKDISTLHLIGINKIYNVHDFYKTFYKDELEEINSTRIINPSSSSWR